MKTKLTALLLLLMLGATTTISAQADGKLALDYLRKEYASFGLEATDVENLRVTDNYASPGGTRHIYVAQQLHGLPVLNAQASLHFRGNRLVHRTSDLATGLAAIPNPAPAVSAQIAVGMAADEVIAAFGAPVAAGTDGEETLFSWPAVSPEPIRARTGYYVTAAGLRLVYEVMINRHATDADVWYLIVDAANGDVLKQSNQVVKCSFDSPNHTHNHDNARANLTPETLPVSERMFEAAVAEESSYLVYRFGEESPNHGERSLEKSPADPEASPFGWHDTNGQDGPEFTITRGNNVWSYPDRNGDDVPDTDFVAEGGDTLKFVEFFDPDGKTDTIVQAALVQTFYTTSILHDWLHHAGFDEAAGNFQRENYTGNGNDRDEVRVEVQDGSGINNANFFTPNDGSSGIMQMFLWSVPEIEVLAPATLANLYDVGLAQFGGIATLTARVVPATDDSDNPLEGCDDLINTEGLEGNIALINRGSCFFEQKVFNAEQAGAAAVIICNNVADPLVINMAEPEDQNLFDVTIPSVMLSMADCALLRTEIENGEEISVIIRSRDGDYDNGIVAHELGHGVSTRLVGGPNNSACLRVDEQMGEGWSDFFALASTPQTNTLEPDGSEVRGIGTFVQGQSVLGRGIRSQPYSTDMSINTKTYDDVIFSGTAPHPLGEVWNAMLWDLYWAMVDEYGFDDDLINGTGGNNQAVQLVVEGLKFTSCRPGFVDGRDGIIAADLEINDGANRCLIWEVFARRGLGFSARQGDTDNRTDGFEAFDLPPTCPGGIGLTKTVDENTINAGEDITYTLSVLNARREATENVVITDVIPAGLTVDAGSVSGADNFTVEGETITFNLGTLNAEDEATIRYTVSSDPTIGSSATFYDGAEDGDDAWFALSMNEDPNAEEFFWEQVDTTPYLGNFAYYVVNVATAQDQALRSAEPFSISGEQPVLRFFTKYETEVGWDGGIVEVSTDETNWERVEDKLVRGSYRGEISPNGSAALQGTRSFWGNSEDEPDANARDYREIIVDMSAYSGQNVFVRFRFVSDAAESARGWWVDEIQMLEAKNYESTATLTSDSGDQITAEVGNFGVLALNAIIDDVNDPALGETKVKVFPNPAQDFVTVKVTTERAGSARVQLMTIDGRVLRDAQLSLSAGGGQTTLNTNDLPAGMYLVQVTGANRVSTTKVTIN